MQVQLARFLRTVKCWTGWEMQQDQWLTEHSVNTAVMYGYLADKEATVKDVYAALLHDAEEVLTSDIPMPMKKAGLVKVDPRLKLLRPQFSSARQKKLHKLADLLDRRIHLYREVELGNRDSGLQEIIMRMRSDEAQMATKLGVLKRYQDLVMSLAFLSNVQQIDIESVIAPKELKGKTQWAKK